jgi:hypothetical protein
VATQKGEVIEGVFQNEIEPLLEHLQAELWRAFMKKGFYELTMVLIPATRMMTSTIVPLLLWHFGCQKR